MVLGSLSLFASNDLLLLFQFLNNGVQRVEACVPELALSLDPCGFLLQAAWTEIAGPHAPDLLPGDSPRLLQDAHMLLHAREGPADFPGTVRDRSVCPPALLPH